MLLIGLIIGCIVGAVIMGVFGSSYTTPEEEAKDLGYSCNGGVHVGEQFEDGTVAK